MTRMGSNNNTNIKQYFTIIYYKLLEVLINVNDYINIINN